MALTSIAAGTSTWAWPAADWPPYPNGNYVERHPTHYTWRPEVEEWARYLVDHYGVWCNSYWDHPATEFVSDPSSGGRHIVGVDAAGTWRREHCSLDVWGPLGRGDPLDPVLGDKIFNLLFYHEGKPDIEWIIWKGYIYGAWNSWRGERFGSTEFDLHNDHIHVGYLPWWEWKPWIPPAPDETVPVDGVAFTVRMLLDAVPGLSADDAIEYHPHLVAMMRRYRINNRARIAAFLGQTGHESGSFQYWSETGGHLKWYDPYYGRGPIQLTLRPNYAAFAAYSGHPVLATPDLVADDTQIGFDSAGWFWAVYENFDLSTLADEATWDAYYRITRIINGGENGWDDRNNRYSQAWHAIPQDVTLEEKPVKEPEPQPEPTPEQEVWEALGWYTWKSRDSWDLVFHPPLKEPENQAEWKEAQVKAKNVRFRPTEKGEVVDLNGVESEALAGQVLVEEDGERFLMFAEDFTEDYEVKPDDGGPSAQGD